MNEIKSICLLGFGEVGASLAEGLLEKTPKLKLRCYDLKINDDVFVQSRKAILNQMTASSSPEKAVEDVDLVISAVTAEQDVAAAKSVAKALRKGAWFLDLNSVSPRTKKDVSEIIEASGGRYIEAAVMSPIKPLGIASPISIGGPNAEEFLVIMRELGFVGSSFYSQQLGQAAASKMCRSVMIKGLESLLSESLLSAKYYGVEEAVVKSLNNLMPGIDWQQHSAYMISRSLEHGVRRAEEMREASKTVKDAGITPRMSAACAETQDWMAQFGNEVSTESLEAMLDQIRSKLNN